MIFNPINPTNHGITIQSSLIPTTFVLDSNQSSIVSVLIHACSKTIDCDRHFVLSRYSWLLDQNHTELIIRENNFPISCVTKSSETDLESSNGEVCNCVIRMSMFLTINHNGQCASREKTSTSVRISTSYSDESCDQHNQIFYIRMYHGWNNQTIFT